MRQEECPSQNKTQLSLQRGWVRCIAALRAYPLLGVAFGLYWMQTIVLFQSPYLLLGSSPLPEWGLPRGTLIVVASVVTYTVWGVGYRRVNGISQHRWFWPILCACLVIGALLYCLGTPLDCGAVGEVLVPYVAGSLLIGCGTGHVCMEVGRLFGLVGPADMLFHGIVALLLGTLGALVLVFLPTVVGYVVLIALPIPMVICLKSSFRRAPATIVYDQGMQTEVRPPTKFWVTSLLQGLALGVMHTLLIDDVGGSALVVSAGYVVAVLLVAGCAFAAKNNFDILIYRIGFPLMALGFFTIGMSSATMLVGVFLLDAGYCFQYLMSCSLCAYLAKGLKQPPIWVIGTSTAFLLGGQFVGSMVGAMVAWWDGLAVTVAFMLVLSALFMTSGRNVRLGWGAVSPGEDVDGKESRTRAACRMVETTYGLTDRESDVLRLLLRGYGRKAVASELCLAEETVKTHLGHIYRKTFVHSKQELIELVARCEDSLERS